MKKVLPVLACLALLSPVGAGAGEVFMCKSYSGGTFWSSAHCGKHNALIERIVSVPDGLPFDQQVQLAEQNRAQAATLAQPPAPVTVQSATVPSNKAECQALDAQIREWDEMARQPLSSQTQAWIAVQRRKARDRQFHIHC